MREANLRALAGRDPVLAGRTAAATPDPALSFSLSRSGHAVPSLHAAGRSLALHSLVDPVKEGERLAATAQDAGFVVALGLGAGWHLRPLLSRADLAGLVVLERDAEALAALLAGADLRDVLADPRVLIAAGEQPPRVRQLVLQAWSPLLCGGLRVLQLRPWCQAAPRWADDAAGAVRDAADDARADFATQARFGRRWFSNILGNLPLAGGPQAKLPRSRRALVAAAGPSLEAQLPLIAESRRDVLLVSVDTALPALVAAGIRPDLVVSIDCQVHGAYHFYGPGARQELLVLDLASPPALARMVPRHAFAAGGHPLCRLLARRWRSFPLVDVSGGNVTHAAVSLACLLGAVDITLAGADYSYPDGKPYARGTYLYDFFGCSAGRLAPAEASFFAFLHRSAVTERQRAGEGFLYTTPLLRAYRDSLQALAAGLPARLRSLPGGGLRLDFPQREPGMGPGLLSGQGGAGEQRLPMDWRGFVRWYADRLRGASAPIAPLSSWLAGIDLQDRECWQTLLPGAAFELREALAGGSAPGPVHGAAALERAREWALARISRVLSEDDPRVPHE